MSLQHLENNPQRWPMLVFSALAIIIGFSIGTAVGISPSVYYLIAIALFMVLVLLSIANLELGLLVFVVITYLRVSDIAVHDYGAPSIARLFIVILVFSLIMRWAVTGHFPKGWIKPAVLVLVYGLVIFGSSLYAAEYTSAQEAAADFWKDGLITILIVALIQKKSTFRKVIWALLLAGIFVATISVYQYNTGTFDNNYLGFAEAPVLNIIGETEGNRVAGPIGDPNFYAQILVVLVPLAINRMLAEKSIWLKLLAGYGILIITLTILYTYSRGGVIALIAALIALAFYKPPRLGWLGIMLAIGVVAILFMPASFMDRMSTITDVISGEQDVRSEVSIEGRTSEMLSAWYMFLDHPILGVGANNYPTNYQTYARKLGLDNRATLREPHNLFLEVAAETGLFGLMVFGYILYYIFKSIQRTRSGFTQLGDHQFVDLIGAFSAGLIGYLTAAMFIHGAYPRYFWLLAGIAMALPQVLQSQKDALITDR
jgi:O-antigen ligase